MPKYQTTKVKSYIYAGGDMLPNGKTGNMKMRKVGYDIIAIKSEINPATGIADMIVGQTRIKRVLYK